MPIESRVFIKEKDTQLFSRGLLAKKFRLLGISSSIGYELANTVYNELSSKKGTTISKTKHDEIVYEVLKANYNKECAETYLLVEEWKSSKIP